MLICSLSIKYCCCFCAGDNKSIIHKPYRKVLCFQQQQKITTKIKQN